MRVTWCALLGLLSMSSTLWAGCSGRPRGSAPRAMPDDDDAGVVCTSCGACEQSLTVTSAQHVSGDIMYPDPPPVGGPHNQCWATWGVHATPVRPENWVHNLEHGGVVFLYACDPDCPDEIAMLSDFVNAHSLAVLTAYAELPTRFAVVSWGHRITSDCLDMDAFGAFYAAHVNQGREVVSSEPPPSCSEFPAQ